MPNVSPEMAVMKISASFPHAWDGRSWPIPSIDFIYSVQLLQWGHSCKVYYDEVERHRLDSAVEQPAIAALLSLWGTNQVSEI